MFALGAVHACHCGGVQPLALLLQRVPHGLASFGQRQAGIAPVIGVGLALQKPLISQTLDQPRKLGLVAPGVLCQIALCSAGVAAEESQHLGIHMRNVVWPVAQHAELLLEFALHGDGPAAGWAAQALPGQRAAIAGPRGSFIIPMDYDWHLLVGDDSALPAIARRLEELPAGSRVVAVVQMAEVEDRRPLASAAAVDVQWVSSTADLVAAVRALPLPEGEGYAWVAGEAAAVAAVRKILVEEKGHDRHAIRAAAYWKQGAVAHHETMED